MSVSAFEEITTKKPEKSLLVSLKKSGGRNVHGRITVRHIGGGEKENIGSSILNATKTACRACSDDRIRSQPAVRISHCCTIKTAKKRYIIAPVGLKVGDEVVSGPEADIKAGNALPLASIPVGTMIHQCGSKAGKGAQLVRSAGNAAQLMAKEGRYAQVRLPSGEVRMILIGAKATIGQVGNVDQKTSISAKRAASATWAFAPRCAVPS